ncbi:MAG: NAD-binding protein [Deltaproteobacteria bacterium]|nr:NAD-binding protein [Deltaproteobacteria bacterium]
MGLINIGNLRGRIFAPLRQFYRLLRDEKLFRILAIAVIIILGGALAIFFVDQYYITRGTYGIFDAIYWAVVTITTVGYGDIVPASKISKLIALMIIVSGPVVLSLLTASIASIFVERKIKEGKGLETIKDKGQIIICGWNENGERVIDGILQQAKGAPPKIVLINELSRDEVQSIQYKYEDQGIRFVRGNYIKEDVLARANLIQASAVIILADRSGGHRIETADERTIFGAMAIKSMASKVRTCAELIHEENREHLLRTHVEGIIVRGESTGSMLATATISPGVADSIKRLINNRDANKLWRIPVPSKFVAGPLGELSAHLRESSDALLFAIIREEEKMKLEDILSDDSSFIDEFIKKKFEESGKDFFGAREDTTITINPPDDYELTRNDWIVVISREKPYAAGLMGRLVGGA